MWLCMTDAFLSVVQPSSTEDPTGEMLLVRARLRGDIRRVFPGATERHVPGRDYAFRALIPRQQVALAVAKRVAGIDYGNVKGATQERDRHDAYAECWGAMFRLQGRRHPELRERSLFSRYRQDPFDPRGVFDDAEVGLRSARPKRRRRKAHSTGKGNAA